MRTIRRIAEEINAAAASYRIGEFQEIRRRIHGLSRPKTREIFTSQTIHDEWAFHSGGRKEIQFNIGFEGDGNEYLRYGLAFSLEASHTLPDPLALKPKVLKLNDYIRENRADLDDLRFWYYFKGDRSATQPVSAISPELIRPHTFLFWGKMSPRNSVGPGEVLFLFDRLLDAYEYVEGGASLRRSRTDLRRGLQFRPGCSVKPETSVQRLQGGSRSVSLRHNILQTALHAILARKYGGENVGTENDTGRSSRVDLVVRDGKRHIYYEIKTGPNIKDCIREALSQLMEYSYWPGGNQAEQMVIVSENPMTPDAREYLTLLRDKLKLPVFYQHLDVDAGRLHEPE